MTSESRPYSLWRVTHPELGIRIELPARSHGEARRIAWERWYRRPLRSELDELLLTAFRTEDTGKSVEAETSTGAGRRTLRCRRR